MATKKTTTTAKKAKTAEVKKTTKKTAAIEKQIENLDKALEDVKEEEVINLVPEEIRADVEADFKAAENQEPEEKIDLGAEVKKIIENAEPSDELKKEIEEFEKGKEEFNEKIEKSPENAEEVIKKEISRVENIKKKVEAMRSNLSKNTGKNGGSEGFTNWWNGSSSLY